MTYLEEKPRVDPVDRVKNMVRHSLVASPGVTNKELYNRAKEIAPAAVEGMTLKQFHAKFRLPVTRFEMGTRPRRERKSAASTGSDNGAAANGDSSAATKPAKPRTRSRSRKSSMKAAANGAARNLVRAAIIDFAVELERAEQRSDLIQVVSRVDSVVERIMEITADPRAATKAAAA